MSNLKVVSYSHAKLYKDHNGLTVIADIAEGCEGYIYDIYSDYVNSVGMTQRPLVSLEFQNGPVSEKGINGITNESLLAILIHRTKFLDNQFPCDENKRAISHMEEALVNLEVRTARRMARGVEGKEVL